MLFCNYSERHGVFQYDGNILPSPGRRGNCHYDRTWMEIVLLSETWLQTYNVAHSLEPFFCSSVVRPVLYFY